jgi:hypothetical protein
MGESRLRLSADGRFSESGPGSRLLGEPGEYRLEAGPNGAYLLERHSEDARSRGRVLMAGELVSRMRVVEILNIITSAQWSGELHVSGPEGVRVLLIALGALKHARTGVESERIGEQLVRAGLLERAELTRLLPDKPADERLGQLLVRRGLLREEQLFKELQQQTEAIFYAAMLVESGMYWFVTPPEHAAAPAVTVHLPVQGLLMEGVQRIDEMALFRERIPHNRFFPNASSGARREALDGSALLVLDLCNGARSINDLSRLSGLGEFATLKIVYHLSRGGQVQLRPAPTLDAIAVRRMVRLFNDIVRDIFVAIATYGSMERTSQALSLWLAQGAHSKIVGEQVDIDGTLDASDVLARLAAQSGEDPMQELHRALHELAAYALFLASNGLPRQEERALARDVNVRLNQLR